jgi:hypothetical protein
VKIRIFSFFWPKIGPEVDIATNFGGLDDVIGPHKPAKFDCDILKTEGVLGVLNFFGSKFKGLVPGSYEAWDDKQIVKR